MKHECDRVRTLHRGGAGWLKSLTPAGASAAAIFGDSIFARLERFEAHVVKAADDEIAAQLVFLAHRVHVAGAALERFIGGPALRPLMTGARQATPPKGYPIRVDFLRSPTFGPNTRDTKS